MLLFAEASDESSKPLLVTPDSAATPTAAGISGSPTLQTPPQQKQQPRTALLATEFRKHATLAGKGKPLHKSLHVSKHDAFMIGTSVLQTVVLADLVLLAAIGWGTVPLFQFLYNQCWPLLLPFGTSWGSSGRKKKPPAPNQNKPKTTSTRDLPARREFQTTLYFHVADNVQQATKIALAVYGVDILKLVVLGLGLFWNEHHPGDASSTGNPTGTTTSGIFHSSHTPQTLATRMPHAFGQTAYTIWAAHRLAALKRYLLRKYVSTHPETFGRIKLVDRLCDALLYAVTVAAVCNILQVQMGVAVQSMLAVGSVGTLAVGLASQGIAKEVLNGLVLASSDRIYEGDDVLFGTTGLAGSIVKLGWMETVVRGSDEIMVSIPNTDLVRERVSNLSRVRLSQVKQVLRLRYDDADKIPMLIDRIKYEIKMSCPELIVDGSRPFRVHWTSMNSDHCELTIDTRHRVKPTGDVYLDNRQSVLTAIHRALRRHNCKLVETPAFITTK